MVTAAEAAANSTAPSEGSSIDQMRLIGRFDVCRGESLNQPTPLLAHPLFWGRLAVRAFTRSWGRDVMLYTGGVSFLRC